MVQSGEIVRPESNAVFEALLRTGNALAAKYDIWKTLVHLHIQSQSRNFLFTSEPPTASLLSDVISELLRGKFLTIDQDFSAHVFRVRDVPDGSPEELCCIVDPFCHVAYLSALQWHGLTDRRPQALLFATPSTPQWKALAMEKVRRDFPDAMGGFFTPYPRPKIPAKVRGRRILFHNTKHSGQSVEMRSPKFRITTLAQTFVDGLLEPELCGGMAHVLNVWKSHAVEHLGDVLRLVDSCESPITKVRAGYILEDIMSLSDPMIESWKQHAQRGSSRKLDPAKPFSEKHSKTWMLSINV